MKNILNFFKVKLDKEEKFKTVYEKKVTGIKGIFTVEKWVEVNEMKVGKEYHLKMLMPLEEFDRIYINGKQIN